MSKYTDMKNLNILFSMFITVLILSACNKKNDLPVTEPEQKIDFNTASISLMDSIRPKLFGSWVIKQLDVTPFPSSTNEIGIFKDTTIYNFATLNINSINNSSYYNQVHNDVTGSINFRSKTYPVGFTLFAASNRIYDKIGPQFFSLFEYRFQSGSHTTEYEESYLQYITLVGENFSIEISQDGNKMIWKGLNRGIKNIQFVKK